MQQKLAAREIISGVPTVPAIKSFLDIWIACSAAFCLCMSGGVYWIAVCWFLMNGSMVGVRRLCTSSLVSSN